MSSEQVNQRANLDPMPVMTKQQAAWGRPLAITVAIVFLISSAFPVVAGFVKDTESWPKWWGTLDVGLAFVLAVLAFVIVGFTQGKLSRQAERASYLIYRMMTHGILVMCLVFYLFSDRIIWTQCLPGFAWRTWLLLYCLPAWFTALATKAGLGNPQDCSNRDEFTGSRKAT